MMHNTAKNGESYKIEIDNIILVLARMNVDALSFGTFSVFLLFCYMLH